MRKQRVDSLDGADRYSAGSGRFQDIQNHHQTYRNKVTKTANDVFFSFLFHQVLFFVGNIGSYHVLSVDAFLDQL